MRRNIKLTQQEKEIENALIRGDYVNVSKKELENIAHAISARRKDAVLNVRVNSLDLKNLKLKAKRLGVKYQTFISELLHRMANL